MSGALTHRRLSAARLDELTKTAVSVYQDPAWAAAVERGTGYRPLGIETSRQGIPVAVMVYFETRKGPLWIAGAPLPGSFTPYQHPHLLAPLGSEEIAAVLAGQWNFLRSRFASIEWTLDDPSVAASLTRATGGVATAVPTLVLALDPDPGVMWARMESRGRNMVRKAEKAGVTIRRCAGTSADVRVYYEMLARTFAKSGRLPPHRIAFYHAMAENLIARERMLLLAAEHEGRTVAMGLFVHDEREIFYTSGTSLPESAALAPNNLIQWHVVSFACERGLLRYDLGGTGIPSIDRFKKSMGGVPHSYTKVVWRSPVAALAAKAFLAARPLLERAKYLTSKARQ